jgi:hypothetical protein
MSAAAAKAAGAASFKSASVQPTKVSPEGASRLDKATASTQVLSSTGATITKVINLGSLDNK